MPFNLYYPSTAKLYNEITSYLLLCYHFKFQCGPAWIRTMTIAVYETGMLTNYITGPMINREK